jgi:hypothetical protein
MTEETATDRRNDFIALANQITLKRNEIMALISKLDLITAKLVEGADALALQAADEHTTQPKSKQITYIAEHPTAEEIADYVKPGKKCSHCVSLGLDGRGHNKRTCPNLHVRKEETSNGQSEQDDENSL